MIPGDLGREFAAHRTQKTGRKKGCRDHHHTAFSMLLAGGGIKGEPFTVPQTSLA